MLSSEGKPTDTEAIRQQLHLLNDLNWEQEIDREQIFRLIETFLSFEACLYHQILPLGLEDKKLYLGMVNTQDKAALEYVTRLLSYVNCTLISQQITPESHRSILSTYLNYKNTSQPTNKNPDQSNSQQLASSLEPNTQTQEAQSNTSIESDNNNTCLSGDKPEEANLVNPLVPIDARIPFPLQPPQDKQGNILTKVGSEATNNLNGTGNLTVLQLTTNEELSPIDQLATLPPKKMLEELLARVLAGGIGRLYLERLPYEGKILWSVNGVVQSVLELLPLSVFQGVLNELKRFACLPLSTFAEAKQVERECLYQQTSLLIRLRVIPGVHGEEATLQVLRGAALKFYQQQMLTRLSRDALGISQQLSYKLQELQQRLLVNPSLNQSQLETYNTLNGLLENLEEQIKNLNENPAPPPDKKIQDSQ